MSNSDRYLPGRPRNRLAKEVRRTLLHWGIRPRWSAIWQATWEWASKIADSYTITHWPMGSEIAAQYVALLLAEMQPSLPYRAVQQATPEVIRRLAEANARKQRRLAAVAEPAALTEPAPLALPSPTLEGSLFHEHESDD